MWRNKGVSLLRRHKEDGFSLIEVLVSAAIILLILTFAATSSSTIFETQASNESRNRAVAIAQDRISRAQLAEFTEVGFPQEYLDKPQTDGGFSQLSRYNDESIIFLPDGAPSLGILPYEEVKVGQYSLRISTYVTQVKPNSFDGTVGSFESPDDLPPRRVTVVVNWDEKGQETQSIVRSMVRYAPPAECAPLHTLNDPSDLNAPQGCLGL